MFSVSADGRCCGIVPRVLPGLLGSVVFALLVFATAFDQAWADDVSFRNEVMPTLSKAGCNLGTCHGNARGKGGFQLSLRGQDPAADYVVLTREWQGRRTNAARPDQSLMLLKPTMQVAHEGGRRFQIDSEEYQLLRNWIAQGSPDDSPGQRRLKRLVVTPHEEFLPRGQAGGWTTRISARAEFTDGVQWDVTARAVYEVAQPIATVAPDGVVSGLQAGETTILVRFLDQQVPVRLAFLREQPGFAWKGPRPANVIDERVYARLQRLQINPSGLCDDSTFIRRLYQDLLGTLPPADVARQFVNDSSVSKRVDLIEGLLDRPEFADWWALKWADLLRIEEKTLDRKGVENFHGWLRDSFATGKPLDQLVREIVAARGSTYEVPPSNFYRALRNPFERSEAAGQLFLGARLQCSKCHNHPFDQWTQDDYYSWGSVFARVDYKILENNRRDRNDSHEFDGEQIVFLGDKGEAKDPRTDKTRPAKLLGAAKLDPRADPLDELATWLTSPQNDRFVKMLANRTWQQIMGRGIVEPVDDFRATNPPSNPELLQSLCDYLRGTGTDSEPRRAFDLKSYLRLILNSNTYQAAAEPNESNLNDESNFSRALIRRQTAEQLLDATSLVLDVPLKFTGYPAGAKAIQLPGVQVLRRREGGPSPADQFLMAFGKPPRLQSCDCERSDETTLGQTFQLVSGSLVNQMLGQSGNRLDVLARSNRPAAELVRDLYWVALTRSPSMDELDQATRYVESATSLRTALEDVAWGLLNSHEFLLRR